MEILNLKENQEYLEEVAFLEREEWGKNTKKSLREKIETMKNNFNQPFFEKLILVDRQELIGFISMFENDMEERKDLKPWYATMYVKKEYRGKGYSRILNHALIQLAQERGIERLYLKTTLHNYYEKFGAKLLETIGEEQIMYIDTKKE